MGETSEGRDHELVVRARGGDLAAFDELVREHAPRVYRMLEHEPQAGAQALGLHSPRLFRRSSNRDRVIFLCWPPHDDDAASYAPLRAYTGEVLVYAGEGREGVTGTVRFHLSSR
ncbi:MAG TPA: hypothetical protein VD769_09530 [Gaiellaceae bacterium]|nr:hypothetical protein [Gaiellaceae bacterium]